MERIPFVGLHAHCGVGSPFDGFGYPEDHMNFAYSNGAEALALTDHGNMNGLAYQIMHAKKMKAEGKSFKPIFGVEAYFIPSVEDWKVQLEEYKKIRNLQSRLTTSVPEQPSRTKVPPKASQSMILTGVVTWSSSLRTRPDSTIFLR